MDSLTRSLRVAFHAPDYNPQPGHDLVIFKQVGTGLEFREVVPWGKRFQKSFFERGEFSAFAVSQDENLRISFSQALTHVDQKHTFIIHLTLHFKVSDSRKVVEKLESDPLKRLKEETLTVIGRTARRLDWECIVQELDFERRLLEQKANFDQGVEISNLQRIRQIGQDLGFSVRSVGIQRTLPKESGVLQGDYDNDMNHWRNINQVCREGELADLRRDNETKDAIHTTAVKTIIGVRDPNAAQDARAILASLEGLGTATRKATSLEISKGDPSNRLLAAKGKGGPVEGLAVEALELISLLDIKLSTERRLASSMLHVIAELSLGNDADDELLEKYACVIRGLFGEVYQRVQGSHIDLMDKLQNPLSFKHHMSSEINR